MNKAYLRDALLVTSGLVVGAGATFVVTKKVLENKYEDLLVEEVHSIRESYRKAAEARMKPDLDELREYADKDVEMTVQLFQDTEELQTEEDLRDAAAEAAQKYTEHVLDLDSEERKRNPAAGEVEDIDDDIDEERRLLENSREARVAAGAAMVHNIFSDPRDKNPMGDADVPPPDDRDKTKPYVISMAEFLNDERGSHDKITVTYFEGDDTLIDDREQVIDDIEGNIGRDKLERFGDLSDDPTIVYVRNDAISADFEVIKDDGYYSVTVLGMSLDEVEPKPAKRRKKQKQDDD